MESTIFVVLFVFSVVPVTTWWMISTWWLLFCNKPQWVSYNKYGNTRYHTT